MKYAMYVECRNVRDEVGEALYGIKVYIFKNGVPFLRFTEEVDFLKIVKIRKPARMEKIALYVGMGTMLDYVNTNDVVFTDGDELVVYVKYKSVWKGVNVGNGKSIEDAFVLKRVVELSMELMKKGLYVRFIHDPKTLKIFLGMSDKSVSSFQVIREIDRRLSLVTIVRSLDSRQTSIDDRVDQIKGYAVTLRRRYYVISKIGNPLSMNIFYAYLE